MAVPGRLEVGRFRVDYRVPADHPAPGALRARLDAAARSRLPGALAAALRSALPDDDGVWLVRRLHVDVGVDASWDDASLARAWAARVAGELVRAISDGGAARADGAGDVLHFADRAAYLARFLADLAADRAWGRWYHAAFEGLRALPASGAVRTAVLDDAEVGARALLGLAERDLARVLASLRAGDARRVLDGIAAVPGAEASDPWTALWRAWESLPPHAVAADAESRVALELYLHAVRTRPSTAGTALRDAARALVRLSRLVGDLDAPATDRLLRALRSGGSAARVAAAPRDADVLAPLGGAPPGWLRGVVRTVAGAPAAAKPASGEETVVRATPFGGALLLLPFLDDLRLDEAAEGWPSAGATPAPAVLRLLLLAKALGSPRAARVFWDPVVRDAAGVHPSLAPPVVRAWLRALPREALPRLLRSLAARRRERGELGGAALALWTEPLPGAPAAVLLDARSGLWLWARGHRLGRAASVAGRAAEWLADPGWAPDLVLADAAFRTAPSPVPGLPLADPERSDAAADDAAVAAVLARRPRLRGDLDHLAAPALGPSRPADLALSVAAQGVLRAFAARLPGFGASSLPYLHANFLDVDAVVEAEAEPERWVVRLGRPPLQFVLAASGTARGEHAPAWLAHPVVLCQEAGR